VSATPNLYLPDGGPTCSEGLATTSLAGEKIAWMELRFYITHTWDSDITTSLRGTTAPNITLWSAIGSSSDNFGNS